MDQDTVQIEVPLARSPRWLLVCDGINAHYFTGSSHKHNSPLLRSDVSHWWRCPPVRPIRGFTLGAVVPTGGGSGGVRRLLFDERSITPFQSGYDTGVAGFLDVLPGHVRSVPHSDSYTVRTVLCTANSVCS